MNEHRDIGFTGDVKIPREITNIKADIVAGLDLREIKYIAVGVILALIDAFIVFGVLKQFGTFAVMTPALCLAPFIMMAKMKKNGMNMEDWLMICYSNNFKGSAIRTNDIQNQYEMLEQLYDSKNKTKPEKVSKKEAKVAKKELKEKIKTSQFRGIV